MQVGDGKRLADALDVLTASEEKTLEEIMAAVGAGSQIVDKLSKQPTNTSDGLKRIRGARNAHEESAATPGLGDPLQLTAEQQADVDGIVAEIKRITGNTPLKHTTLNYGGNH